MTAKSVFEFLIDGEWLKPLNPPLGYLHPSAWNHDGWVGTTALEFDHPRHGRIKAVPRMFLCRLAES